MKKIISNLLCMAMLIVLLGSTATFANDEIRVFVNNEQIQFDFPPAHIDNRVLVQFRPFVEAFGAEIEFNADEQISFIHFENATLSLQQQGDIFVVHRRVDAGLWHEFDFDVPPQMVNGVIMLPVRAIAEVLFGAEVMYSMLSPDDVRIYHRYAPPPPAQAFFHNRVQELDGFSNADNFVDVEVADDFVLGTLNGDFYIFFVAYEVCGRFIALGANTNLPPAIAISRRSDFRIDIAGINARSIRLFVWARGTMKPVYDATIYNLDFN